MNKYHYSPYVKQRTKNSVLLTNKKILLIGIGVIVLSSLGLIKTTLENHRLDVWVVDSKQKLVQLEQENQNLTDNLNYVSSLNYHEKKAKEKLNMQESGEQVIAIQGIDASQALPVDQEENPTPTPVLPNWSYWYNFFLSADPPRV